MIIEKQVNAIGYLNKMELKPLNHLFNNLVLAEISGDYNKVLIDLYEISKYEFMIKDFEIELIDSCLKNSVSKIRKDFNKITFLIQTIEYNKNISKSIGSSNMIYFDDKIKELNQSTRDLIKCATRDEGGHSHYSSNIIDDIPIFTQKYLLMKIKEDFFKQLSLLYQQVINICNNFLNNLMNKNSENIKLFFLKTIADYRRYYYELTNSYIDKKEAENAYTEAKKEALKLRAINKYDMLFLKFYLNYSVFLYDIMEDYDKAIEETTQVLKTTLQDYEVIKSNEQKDLVLIWQIMKENVALWMKTKPNEFQEWLGKIDKKDSLL